MWATPRPFACQVLGLGVIIGPRESYVSGSALTPQREVLVVHPPFGVVGDFGSVCVHA